MYQLLLGETPDELGKLESNSVHLVVCSPPYVGAGNLWGEFWDGSNFDNAHAWLDKIWDECVRVLAPGCKLAINVANTGRRPYLDNCARIATWGRWNQDKVEHLGNIVWDKSHGVTDTAWGSYLNPSDISLTDDCEFILIFRKCGKRDVPKRGKLIDKDDFLAWRHSIWKIKAESAKAIGHIAPFPLEIPRRLITLYSFEGETVLDPFMGSGTTTVAAEMLNRNSVGIDHLQKNIDLAHDRINKVQANMGKEVRKLSATASVSPLFV